MRFRILRTAIYSLGIALLFGCVTEQSYVDSNQQVRILSFDQEDAAKSRLLLGLGYLHNNNYPQAKFNLDKALEYAPKRADVHYSLAYYYQAVGESKQAEESYKISLDIEPDNPDTLNNYGVFLCDLGNYEEALIQFKLAITIPSYTQVAQSYENMALCVLKANDFTNAINYLNTSYQHNPKRPETLLNLISLHYAKGDTPLAFELYKRYLFNFEETASILLLGFLLETSAGRHEVAKQYLMRLSSMFPLSRENLLLNANLLHESIFEQRKQQFLNNQNSDIQSVNYNKYEKFRIIESTQKSVLNPVVFGGVNVTEKIPTLTINPNSVHSVVGIGKNLSLPEEIIISENSDNSGIEIIERVPLLDINVDNVEIPRYTVQYGENLYRVSIKFNIQISTLMKWNKLKNQQINAGDQLYVKDPDVFYTVKQANNLSKIADELNIPLDKLMLWNKVEQDGIVAAGTQILKVEVEPLK
jgi:type IV pilus assembly protein PilF